jgi:hypothetical protein
MNIRLHLRFRAIMAALAGLTLLLEAVNLEFLRSPVQGWTTMVNTYIAIFGAVFLIQSWRFFRRLQTAESK